MSRQPELVSAKDAATFAQNQKRYWAADVVAISKDGSVLLVQRPKEPQKGFSALPGGMLKPTENYDVAAKRECFEECGIKLPGKMKPCAAGVFDKEGRDPRNVPVESHAFCYVLNKDANDMSLKGEEDLKARWVPFEELRDEKFYADHRHVLLSLLKAAGDRVPEALRTLLADEVGEAANVCVSSKTEIEKLLAAKPEGPILCIDLVVSSADEESFLLVKRPEKPNLLSAIGGIIKPTEAPWETCLRKLREIGILEDVEPRPTMFFAKGKREGVEVATFLYWVELGNDAKEKLALKGGGAEWVNVDERSEEEFFADHFILLRGCRMLFE